jgi:hypothetical protein
VRGQYLGGTGKELPGDAGMDQQGFQ